MKKSLFCLSFLVILFSACTSDEERLVKMADRIHEKVLTVDTHCDTPMEMVRSGFDLGMRHEEGCVDFPRMKEGGLNAEFFAVFIGQGPRDDSSFNITSESREDL